MNNEVLEVIKKLTYQYAFLKASDIPFRDYVVEACAMNYCGRYNKTWQCPPGIGKLQDLQERCLSFEKGLLFTTLHKIEDSFDIEGMNDGRIEHEKITDKIVELFDAKNIHVLSAEGCGLCEKCTYPTSPCRYPQKARSSVEAYGISVVEMAQNCNINYKNGVNTVTYFSLILFND